MTAGSLHSPRLWAVRITVLTAFAVTVWLYGPRAVAVLAARCSDVEQRSPEVLLDHVGLGPRPDWLQPPLLLHVCRDLQPFLSGGVPILDDQGALDLQRDLRTVPWVRDVRLARAFPDRFRVALDLRRPVLAVQDAHGGLLALVDRDGIALPAVVVPQLPCTVLRAEGGRAPRHVVPGQPFPDQRVVAAAAVAVEWRDTVAPLVSGCPQLLEVDANNLGERYISHPRHPEIRVLLRRDDGAPVVFAYDHPPDSAWPRVPAAAKARILQQILQKHPALQALTYGDLRMQVTWEKYLLPTTGRDPVGPWPQK